MTRLLLALLFAALPVAAQEVTRLPEGTEQSVSFDAGLQSALVARAAYARRVGPGLVYARFTLPFAALDPGDFAVEAGAQATALSRGNWQLQAALAPVVRATGNSVFTATAFGLRAALMPGYQGERWGLLAEVAYEKTVAAHLVQSDAYRRAGYPGAKDGWYAWSAGTLQAGLRGGVRLGRVELSLAAGLMATEKLNPVTPPFYATLGSAWAF